MKINSELKEMAEWLKVNKLTLNINKTLCMLFSKKHNHADISINLEGKQNFHMALSIYHIYIPSINISICVRAIFVIFRVLQSLNCSLYLIDIRYIYSS